MKMLLLDWIILSLSLTNTVLLFWLGFTLLLNAERRTWGVWIMSGGLLVSAAFFVSHSAIVGYGLTSTDPTMTFWWYLGLLTALMLPYVWHVVVLWYTGFWDKDHSPLFRQRIWFALSSTGTICLIGLLLFANPFPSYQQVIALNLTATPSLFGIPLLIVAYALSTIANVMFALDGLWHPAPSAQAISDTMRRRARPWLLAVCLALLLVSLLVAAVMLWVIGKANQVANGGLSASILVTISLLDLVISSVVTVSTALIGQAIVRYEAFTGKILPERRFMRHWRNIVTLSLGFGFVMSGGIQLQVHPVYSVLLMAGLVTFFYAMFSRNSYVERQRYIHQLRPFVLSQRLYDNLVKGTMPTEVDLTAPFNALCQQILGTRLAYLIPTGPLAPLVGPGLTYPNTFPPPHVSLHDFSEMQPICTAVDAARYGGATWAIPLWSERGLIGVFLLGDKENGSLYTQEEIELAQSTGERLIDTQASAEMARRLMALQRQRLAESQVVDRRTRRTLHDEVLPRLHAAMLTLSAQKCNESADSAELVQSLTTAHHQIADLLVEMPAKIAPELAQNALLPALREVVNGELATAFDAANWQIEPGVEQESRAIPPLMTEVLFYAAREMIRNAARHGRGQDTARWLQLCVKANWHNGLELSIEDNGVGFEPPRQSGHGLALHSTMMAVIGGSLSIESVPNQLTRVALTLPRETW